MPNDLLNLTFVLTTCVAVGVTCGAVRRARGAATPVATTSRKKYRILGVAAFVAYSVVRDSAVVALMTGAGTSPATFLFVDLACLVPYFLAAPRAARAATEGRLAALGAWAAAFLYGALAPVIYVAQVFKQAAGPVATLATVYVVLIAAGGICGLLRKSGRVSAALGLGGRTATVRA